MGNGHSAIDRLIALTALKKYQEGGEVSPTWGERFVKMFPSKHKDPERAAEQQRALTGLIDFFAPQSAAEAGLMLAAGPVLGRVAKASRAPLKKLYRGVEKWHRGKMVKGGRHLSPESYSYDLPNPSKKGVWAAEDMEAAEEFANTFGDKSGYVLEYNVPSKFYDKASSKWSDPSSPLFGIPDWIEGGIPKEYLTKVHKGYQEGGEVGSPSQVDLAKVASEYEDFIRKWVKQRPAVTSTYEDLIGAIQSGKLTAQQYPQDKWEGVTKAEGLEGSPAAFLSKSMTGMGPDAEFLSGTIKYPTGGESSIPHELLHYFASHRPGQPGTPKTINPYIKLDMALKGWLPSLHPAGRRPSLPGKTKLGQWWNRKFATKQAPYSDNPTGAPKGEETPYHPWYDEDAFDRIGAEYGEFAEQFRTGEDFQSGKRFIDDLAQNPVTKEVKPAVPQAVSEMPVSFDKNKYPIYNKQSNKAQSFRDAFRQARREGEATFTWDGRLYTSELKK